MNERPILGFALLSHLPPTPHFVRLLERIKEIPDSIIALHHDFSQSDFPQHLVDRFGIRLVTPSRKTAWGHVSKVPAMLDVLHLLYHHETPADWYISLSPTCYPIKSAAYIYNFFRNTTTDVFMECNPLGYRYGTIYKWHYRTLFTRRIGSIPFISRKGKFYMRPIRVPLPRRLTPFSHQYPYTGSDWWMLNRKAMQQIAAANFQPMLNFMERANRWPDMNASPIEITLQTFFGNRTDLRRENKNYRVIDWERTKDWHPHLLTMRHWPAIRQSDALWARKFSWPESKELLDHIDATL